MDTTEDTGRSDTSEDLPDNLAEVQIELVASQLDWDPGTGTTLTIASPLDNPGEWLYHCHILEHAEQGMAGVLEVRP